MKKLEKEEKKRHKIHSEKSSLDALVEKGCMSEAVGAIVQQKFTNIFGGMSIGAAMDNMLAESKKIKSGNLESAENILIIQGVNLNAIFNSLMYEASVTEFVPHYEMLLRLAFKAQAQSRVTLEALATIKNPPQVAFVKQANISHTQQVNNNVSHESASRAEELKNRQTQLLEEYRGERLDTGKESSSIAAHKELATLEEVHRAEEF